MARARGEIAGSIPFLSTSILLLSLPLVNDDVLPLHSSLLLPARVFIVISIGLSIFHWVRSVDYQIFDFWWSRSSCFGEFEVSIMEICLFLIILRLRMHVCIKQNSRSWPLNEVCNYFFILKKNMCRSWIFFAIRRLSVSMLLSYFWYIWLVLVIFCIWNFKISNKNYFSLITLNVFFLTLLLLRDLIRKRKKMKGGFDLYTVLRLQPHQRKLCLDILFFTTRYALLRGVF